MRKTLKLWCKPLLGWRLGHFGNSLSLRMKSLGIKSPSLHALGSSLQGTRDLPHQSSKCPSNTTIATKTLALGWRQALKDDILSSKGKSLGLQGLGEILQGLFLCLQSQRSSPELSQGLGHGIQPVGFLPQWRPNLSVFLQNVHQQSPAKIDKYALQGSQVKASWQVESHLMHLMLGHPSLLLIVHIQHLRVKVENIQNKFQKATYQ